MDAASLYRESLKQRSPAIPSCSIARSSMPPSPATWTKRSVSRIASRSATRTIARRVLRSIVEAFRNNDYAGARAEIAKSAKGPFTALTLSLLDAWARAGAGQHRRRHRRPQRPDDRRRHRNARLLPVRARLRHGGQERWADAAYRQTVEAGVSPRSVEAYGRFLERTGRTAEARERYTKASGASRRQPDRHAGPGAHR